MSSYNNCPILIKWVLTLTDKLWEKEIIQQGKYWWHSQLKTFLHNINNPVKLIKTKIETNELTRKKCIKCKYKEAISIHVYIKGMWDSIFPCFHLTKMSTYVKASQILTTLKHYIQFCNTIEL